MDPADEVPRLHLLPRQHGPARHASNIPRFGGRDLIPETSLFPFFKTPLPTSDQTPADNQKPQSPKNDLIPLTDFSRQITASPLFFAQRHQAIQIEFFSL